MTREHLPPDRPSVTRVFRLAHAHEDGRVETTSFYFTVGLYEDGRVAELFLKADKAGSTMSGALDTIGLLFSMLLQNGVPLEDILPKLRHTRFPPAGFTKDPNLPSCTSPMDLLAQFLAQRFLPDPLNVKANPP